MFKFNATSKWYQSAAKLEADHDISSGLPCLDLATPQKDRDIAQGVTDSAVRHDEQNYRSDFRQAGYSRFMHKLRINAGLSIKQLAKKLDVAPEQLLLIEQRIGYKAPPRTLSHLAKFYELPFPGFLQLAGAIKEIDKKIEEDVVRFAAESDSFEKLSKEEKRLLNDLVKVIRDYATKVKKET